MLKLTLFTSILISFLGINEACMCMPRHPQAAFCSAGFALKGMVISERITKKAENSHIFEQLGLPVPVYAYYEILVMKLYKGKVLPKQDNFSNFFKVKIQTNQQDAACGTSFTRGKTYLITGRMFKDELQVNQCDWVEEYKLLTKKLKTGLKGGFDCKCQINTCMNGYCDNESACKWNLNYDKPIDECTQRHRICSSNSKGKCEWAHSIFYDVCKNKTVLDVFKDVKP